MHVFVCHAAPDRDAAARLRADLAQTGRQVALDRGEPNGPQWWDTVLARIRGCAVFVFIATPESARSPGCLAELRYAAALGKPLAAARPRPGALPEELADAPVIDLGGATAERVPRLRGVLDAIPDPGPLPQPLPPEPPVPYLDVYRARLEQHALDQQSQLTIMTDLRSRLLDPTQRAAAWGLLVRLREREDIAGPVAATLEAVLAPGWQPDPERRVDRRYWDGQTWTTLVRHEGREFNERRVPPPEATWSGAPVQQAGARAARPPRNRKWLLIGVTAAAVAVAVGVVLTVLLPGVTDSDDDPVLTARTFVDAVNVADVPTLQGVTCERQRPNASALFLGGGFRLTLERVQADAQPPTFTVLATDTRSGSVDRRTFPLVRESGDWLVCAP